MAATRLLAAFDQTIAAVRRMEAVGLRTNDGASAQSQLGRLLEELTAQRAAIADGAPLDPEWPGRVVRWVAEWIPESELPLLARLGGIARAGRGD
ncbi:MAG: hypothetical protein ACJ8DJ_06840 [Gemmatimonadales bacterium]